MDTKRKFWGDMIKCLEYLETPISKLQYNYFKSGLNDGPLL